MYAIYILGISAYAGQTRELCLSMGAYLGHY
jgi:hypothetical protein